MRSDRLSQRELDVMCKGLGPNCTHCGERMPQPADAPRPCSALVEEEEAARLESKMDGNCAAT